MLAATLGTLGVLEVRAKRKQAAMNEWKEQLRRNNLRLRQSVEHLDELRAACTSDPPER